MTLAVGMYRHVARLAVVVMPVCGHFADSGKWVRRFQEWSRVYTPLQTIEDRLGCRPQPDDQVSRPHGGTVGRVEHSAAAGTDDGVLLGADVTHHTSLEFAEVRFALVLKDLGDSPLFLPFDFVIGINEAPAQFPRQQPANGGLARARKADEYYALYFGSPSM